MDKDIRDVPLYARGFCVSPSPVQLLEELSHYRCVRVGDQFLYADEFMELDWAVGDEGWAIVVGKAWPLSTGPLNPVGSVAQHLLTAVANGVDVVESCLYDLAGRYAVIVNFRRHTYVYGDAAGTRSVFFAVGSGFLTSHYDMLSRIIPVDVQEFEPYGFRARPEKMWDFTEHAAIKALLPNQRLHLESGVQDRFFPLSTNRHEDSPIADRLDVIEQLWNEQLQCMVEMGVPIAASMSGGLDSRTLLAMAKGIKRNLRSMTYTTRRALEGLPAEGKWAEVMDMDYRIVRSLEEFLPEEHFYITRRSEDQKWLESNAGTMARNSIISHGRWILPGYLSLFSDPRSIHYRGNLLEIGRLHMGAGRQGDGRFDQVHRVARFGLASDGSSLEVDSVIDAGLETLSYGRIHEDYLLADMFYWELRHGRWYAQVLNETDVAFDTISPVNVRRILDIFLSFDIEDRRSAFAQKELIYRNHPVLLFFGINELNDLYRPGPGRRRE